jgi:hypothetical protein
MLDLNRQDYSTDDLLTEGENLALHDVNGFRFVIGKLNQSSMSPDQQQRFDGILFTARFRLQSLFHNDFSGRFYSNDTVVSHSQERRAA